MIPALGSGVHEGYDHLPALGTNFMRKFVAALVVELPSQKQEVVRIAIGENQIRRFRVD